MKVEFFFANYSSKVIVNNLFLQKLSALVKKK